jgi:hypothetical protein
MRSNGISISYRNGFLKEPGGFGLWTPSSEKTAVMLSGATSTQNNI